MSIHFDGSCCGAHIEAPRKPHARIKQMFLAAGIEQREIAREVGISDALASMLLQGQRSPHSRKARAFFKELNAALCQLGLGLSGMQTLAQVQADSLKAFLR